MRPVGNNISSTEGVVCHWQVIDHMKIWTIRWNTAGFLLGYSCIQTTVWMHHINVNKIRSEKARWERYKNAIGCPESNIHKIAAVRPPISHLKSNPIKRTRHAEHCWKSKGKLISDVCLCTPTHERANIGKLEKMHQLYAVTGCSLKDLPRAMSDWEELRERNMELHTISTTL